jgi:hypothetical protein
MSLSATFSICCREKAIINPTDEGNFLEWTQTHALTDPGHMMERLWFVVFVMTVRIVLFLLCRADDGARS